MKGTVRRLLGAAAAWLVLAAVIRLFVLAPEQCEPPAPHDIDATIDRAVGWFVENQLPDGRFVYAYERGDEPDRAIQLVRHHGVLMSLYQAAQLDVGGAFAAAEKALAWSLDRIVEPAPGLRAVGFEGSTLRTGSTALLVAALVERERVVAGDEHHELLVDLGRFLLDNVDDDGAVSSSWEPETGPVGDRSLFFTGEVMWALSLLAEAAPSGPVSPGEWADTARRIGHHIALDRDRAEGRIALTPDHWSGYGLDQIERVAGPATSIEIGHARRTAGLISVRIRLESQNPDTGPIRLTRGAHSLGAGVGTLGEGLAGIIRLAERDDRLADLREPMRDNLACVTGLLVDRQLVGADARSDEDAALVEGAWFRNDRTQQDDQQHALSALLAARLVLDGTEDRARNVDHDDLAGWIVLALTLLAATDPVRARVRRRNERPTPRSWMASGGFVVAAAAVAVLADPLLDGGDLSEPTVRLAAGLVVMVTAGSDILSPERTGATIWRPGPFLVLLAGGADPGFGGALFAVALTALVVAIVEGTERSGPSEIDADDSDAGPAGWSERHRRASRFIAALALLLGADLAVDGVFEL